jgi:dihydroxyacid dehydratase/phosphogluconate dehydratase
MWRRRPIAGGLIALVEDGDSITIDAHTLTLAPERR